MLELNCSSDVAEGKNVNKVSLVWVIISSYIIVSINSLNKCRNTPNHSLKHTCKKDLDETFTKHYIIAEKPVWISGAGRV